MDFDTIISRAVSFYGSYKILTVVLVAAVLLFAFTRPRQTFKLMVFLLVVSGIVYAVSVFGNMVETGAVRKDQMIHKSKDVIEE